MTVVELVAKLGLKVDEGDFQRGEAALGGLRSGLAVIGLSVGAARVALEAMVTSVATTAGAVTRASQRIGVGREAFQELTAAAEHSGVSAESFEQGLKFLNRGIYEATHGNGELSMAFRRLGVATRDSSGKLRSADQVLFDLTERFKDMPDGPEKVALAMRLFGRSGTELIPMLNKGKEALVEYGVEAREFGVILGEEDFAAAKQFKMASLDLDEALHGLKTTIGKALLREFASSKKAMADWVKANREWIATGIHKAVTLLTTAIQKAKQMAEPFLKVLMAILSNTVVWKGLLVAISLIAMAQFGNAIKGAATAVWEMWSALRAVTAMQTIGAAASLAAGLLWAAGIAIVALAIEDLYTFMQGGDSAGMEFMKWLDNILKINPDDSVLVKGLKGLLQIIFDIQGALQKLDRWARQDSVLQNSLGLANSALGYTVSGTAAMLPAALGGGNEEAQRQREYLAGMSFYGNRLLGKRSDTPSALDNAILSLSGGQRGPATQGASITVQFGDVNVGPVKGGTVEELQSAFGDVIEEKLQQILNPAYEAAPLAGGG